MGSINGVGHWGLAGAGYGDERGVRLMKGSGKLLGLDMNVMGEIL